MKSYKYMNLIILACFFLILNHYSACFMFAIAKSEYLKHGNSTLTLVFMIFNIIFNSFTNSC